MAFGYFRGKSEDLIRFFRINDPYRVLFVFLILIALRVIYGLIGMPLSWLEFKHLLLGEWLAQGFSMYTETFDYTAPLSAWTYQGIDALFGRSRIVHWIISGLLVVFQAAYFNRTLLTNKVLSEPNYVPAFLYVIFSIATFDFFALSPQLMSLTFVIVSMDHLIRRMDNVAGDELFLFPGFYLGLAGMFYLPSVAFFLVFLLAIILIVRAKPRRVVLYIHGWLIANALVLVIIYVLGNFEEFWAAYFVEIFRQKIYYVSTQDLLVWMAIPSLFFLVSLFAALGSREGSLHVKTQQFMLLILVAAIGVVLLGGTLSGVDLVFFMPVFTFFSTNYFLKIKKRMWRFLIPNVMILGSVCAPFVGLYFDLFNDNLIVQNSDEVEEERVLVIGPISPIYLNAEIAGPFFDERIGKDRLEDLEYYNRAPVFLEIFNAAQPDLVIDEWKAMDRIEYRFPEIMEKKIPRRN